MIGCQQNVQKQMQYIQFQKNRYIYVVRINYRAQKPLLALVKLLKMWVSDLAIELASSIYYCWAYY